jgi:GAF domain-containing protein
VPIVKNGKVIGEIDVDSDYLSAFTEEDKNFLEKVAKMVERKLGE